jgi:hypothetical protein
MDKNTAVNFLKSLNFGKEDLKKMLMFTAMCFIACLIFNTFLGPIRIDFEYKPDINVTFDDPYGFLKVDLGTHDEPLAVALKQ